MTKNHTFKLGDQIAMLNDPITGKIVDISDKFIVLLAEDGFEYECKINEVVPNSDLHTFFYEGLDEAMANKEKTTSKTNANKKKKSIDKSQILEVDLHIHHLIPSEKGMSNFEILGLQLKIAKSKLELAIKKKNQKIVFIHGIGEGVLRRELHLLLKKYPVEYHEGSYQKYGQGATEVVIYQNVK